MRRIHRQTEASVCLEQASKQARYIVAFVCGMITKASLHEHFELSLTSTKPASGASAVVVVPVHIGFWY